MSLNKKPITMQHDATGKHNWIYVIIIFFVLVLHDLFGALTYDVFVILDNAFHSSGANSPVFMWSLIGSLIGIAIGSIIASRKFKLSRKVNMVSAIPAGILIFSLLIGSGPISQIVPRPEELSAKIETGSTDSTTITTNTPTDVKRQKTVPVVNIKSEAKAVTKRPSCEEETAGVSVTIRSDSVRLFYRTSAVKDGEWSDWESIFIPQPGQYALSGANGKVKANSIQYYYDAKLEATRSANDPFIKRLCDGSLNIETY